MTTANGHDVRSSPPNRPIHVLLVDDQRFVALVVERLLGTETDIEFSFCLDSADALARAIDTAPSIIFQDLFMPNVDGLEMVRRFRADPATAGIPIVVLSGNNDAETRQRAMDAGAIDYLVKLPSKPDLLACIRKYAGQPLPAPAASPLDAAQP